MSLPNREEMSTRILVALIGDRPVHAAGASADAIMRSLASLAAFATDVLIEENSKYD